jgi:hypothetical protein
MQIMALVAVQHIKRMRGGAQSHLIRCSDNHLYVVKFQNNPQHCRILANEMLATRLSECVGLPVPATEVIEVEDWLIEHRPELNVQLANSTFRCAAGRQFGSRYIVDPLEGQVMDYIPVEMLARVRNVDTFAGILAMDKWTGNADGRQAAFWRRTRERNYNVAFIDQGFCFNAEHWTFPDFPLHGVYGCNEVYATIRNWESFEPWLSRIETMKPEEIWPIALEIPQEWYGADQGALNRLVEELLARREMVRGLIESLRLSDCSPFPSWVQGPRRPSRSVGSGVCDSQPIIRAC